MRNNHYTFAHCVLRSFTAEHSSQFFDRLTSEQVQRFLSWLWKRTAQLTGEALDDIDTSQTHATPCLIASRQAVVIELPAPINAAEAFLVVVTQESLGPGRYFVLELGNRPDGEPRTVLCEWISDTHWNYGDGPSPNVDAVIAAIGERLQANELRGNLDR